MKKYVEIEKLNDGGSGEELSQDFTVDELVMLKTMFLALEAAVDEIQLPASNNGEKSGRTFPGTQIFEILAKAQVRPVRFHSFHYRPQNRRRLYYVQMFFSYFLYSLSSPITLYCGAL